MQLSDKNECKSITAEEFKNLVEILEIGLPRSIAVGVSGGADSLALTLLLNQYCQDHSIRLFVLTVDHGLREKSKGETKQLSDWLSSWDIELHILKWIGQKPIANIQDEARAARYRLMGQWCKDNEISHLFLAHHMQDQAETFLIRLFRGSGVDGLSAMKKNSEFPTAQKSNNFPKVYRPLLGVNKESLEKYLLNINQKWIEDPSNNNDKFTRVQVRDLLQNNVIKGFDAARLSSTAERMQRVRSFLEEQTILALSDYVSYSDFGYASLDLNFQKNLHEEISLRLLSKVLKTIGGRDYPPRHKKLKALLNTLKKPKFLGKTLSGVIMFQISKGCIIFTREPKGIPDEINITKLKTYQWDNRFLMEVGEISGKVVPIDESVVKYIVRVIPDIKERFLAIFDHHQLRDRVLPSLPCIIDDNGKLILPDFLLSELNGANLDSFSAVFNK